MSDESRGQALRFNALNQSGVSSASTDLDGNPARATEVQQ
jgi:hypothetical protein